MIQFKRATVSFRRLFYSFGDVLGGHIRIDLKRNTNPIRVYLHELIHVKHPDWSETKVIKMERKIWKRMTHKQVFYLGKRLFSRKFESDKR